MQMVWHYDKVVEPEFPGQYTGKSPRRGRKMAPQSSAAFRGFVILAVPTRLAPWASVFRSYELWFAAFPHLHICVSHPPTGTRKGPDRREWRAPATWRSAFKSHAAPSPEGKGAKREPPTNQKRRPAPKARQRSTGGRSAVPFRRRIQAAHHKGHCTPLEATSTRGRRL